MCCFGYVSFWIFKIFFLPVAESGPSSKYAENAVKTGIKYFFEYAESALNIRFWNIAHLLVIWSTKCEKLHIFIKITN